MDEYGCNLARKKTDIDAAVNMDGDDEYECWAVVTQGDWKKGVSCVFATKQAALDKIDELGDESLAVAPATTACYRHCFFVGVIRKARRRSLHRRLRSWGRYAPGSTLMCPIHAHIAPRYRSLVTRASK